MKIKVIFQGQVGAVAGLQQELVVVNSSMTVAECISEVALGKTPEVTKFLVDAEGAIAAGLFVALDSEHVVDYEARIGEANELLLMTPMAGG